MLVRRRRRYLPVWGGGWSEVDNKKAVGEPAVPQSVWSQHWGQVWSHHNNNNNNKNTNNTNTISLSSHPLDNKDNPSPSQRILWSASHQHQLESSSKTNCIRLPWWQLEVVAIMLRIVLVSLALCLACTSAVSVIQQLSSLNQYSQVTLLLNVFPIIRLSLVHQPSEADWGTPPSLPWQLRDRLRPHKWCNELIFRG